MFGRATITLGSGPHSSFACFYTHCSYVVCCVFVSCIYVTSLLVLSLNISRRCGMSETYGSFVGFIK